VTIQLPPMPNRIKRLSVDERGYPIPWFVAWQDGKPLFPVADGKKMRMAIQQKLCWVCGEKLNENLVFVLGPMCTITRTSSEPPSHLDCATFSAMACPFLSKPRMKRMEEAPGTVNPAGIFIKRNPGCCALWSTRSYTTFESGTGELIEVGEPTKVQWFAEGRQATREEIMESIRTGIGSLEDIARQEGKSAVMQLAEARQKVMKYLPIS
jgi:hypothetical protein